MDYLYLKCLNHQRMLNQIDQLKQMLDVKYNGIVLKSIFFYTTNMLYRCLTFICKYSKTMSTNFIVCQTGTVSRQRSWCWLAIKKLIWSRSNFDHFDAKINLDCRKWNEQINSVMSHFFTNTIRAGSFIGPLMSYSGI